MKPKSKPPGTQRLILKHNELLSILNQLIYFASILLQFCFQVQVAPLHHGDRRGCKVTGREQRGADVVGRGFHSSTSQLTLTRFSHRKPSTTKRIPQKVLTFSHNANECEALVHLSALTEPF
jgi:hypothetical protein